ELRELAHGIRPATLTQDGLMPSVLLLAGRCPIPVDVTGDVGRLEEPIEATLYFVCSEGLANAVKHSRAAKIAIHLHAGDGLVTATVSDDGIGGAALDNGTGLRGLADRAAALGGRLQVSDRRGGGTVLSAEIPC